MGDLNSTVLLLIAVFNMITALLAWLTHRATKETQRNVELVEKATNSMKDALVTATGLAAHAAGLEEGRAAGERKAAALVEKESTDKSGVDNP